MRFVGRLRRLTRHLEKDHKNDSSDSECMVGKFPPYKLKMGVRMVKKRKYEVRGETEEIDEATTDMDASTSNSTYGDSALGAYVKYESQEHLRSLSDVPQLTTWIQASTHRDEEEDARMTHCLTNMSLETEQILQPTTQPPVEQWPTEAPEGSNTNKIGVWRGKMRLTKPLLMTKTRG
jgi:hypothetical protein